MPFSMPSFGPSLTHRCTFSAKKVVDELLRAMQHNGA
jgi:hypothetical protein